MKTLKESLKDWQDMDFACCLLAEHLGVVEEDVPAGSYNSFRSNKALYWSANPVGDKLYEFLFDMVDMGILEIDEEREKFRWNPAFNSWEEVEKK